jgi:hypothetical protein
MKKFAVLALLLSFSVVVGCDSKKKAETPAAPPAGEAAPPADAAAPAGEAK